MERGGESSKNSGRAATKSQLWRTFTGRLVSFCFEWFDYNIIITKGTISIILTASFILEYKTIKQAHKSSQTQRDENKTLKA